MGGADLRHARTLAGSCRLVRRRACTWGSTCSSATTRSARRRSATTYDYARDNDLYLTYVIISPQADRGKGAGEQSDEFLVAGVCDEDREGITIRGAKMLGTGCPIANEVFVGAIQPLKPGEEKHSVTAMVPLNAKGLKILSRKSFEAHAASKFDNPLSSSFDENDAVLYLRRGEGAVGAGVRPQRRADGAGAVARDSDARLPELPVPDPADGEAALPRRTGEEDCRDQRHRQLPAGARDAGSARRRGGDGRGHGRRHGDRPAGTTASTSCRTSGCSMRRWC